MTKLDVAHTANDILQYIEAQLSLSANEVNVHNISKEGVGYSAFKIWCHDDVFHKAMDARLWPAGAYIREWVDVSKNCPARPIRPML